MDKKILIVDDNVEFCANITDVLGLKGYETVEVYNGPDAIEAVKKEQFGLILMDFKMPMMDGLATFRKIKEINKEISVIMITAYSVEENIKEALREGLFGSFKKPVEFEKLFSSIEKALPDGGALVLIADDDETLCNNVLDLLTKNGYKGVLANDGASAVQMARENNFDVIFLNIQIAVMHGFEAFLTIRNIRPDVKLITITEKNEEIGDIIKKTLDEKIYARLEKPVNMDQLLEILKKALVNN